MKGILYCSSFNLTGESKGTKSGVKVPFGSVGGGGNGKLQAQTVSGIPAGKNKK